MLSALCRRGLRVVYEEVRALGVNPPSALGGNVSSNASYFPVEGADAKENLGSRKRASCDLARHCIRHHAEKRLDRL